MPAWPLARKALDGVSHAHCTISIEYRSVQFTFLEFGERLRSGVGARGLVPLLGAPTEPTTHLRTGANTSKLSRSLLFRDGVR